jgi:cell division protein FtsB
MAQKNRKVRKPSKPFTTRDLLVSGILTVLLVWLVFLNINIAKKEEIARSAAHATQAELANLSQRQGVLTSDIDELSTARGQEATVRETFGVAKPGEGEIIIVPPKIATTTPPLTFWQKYFGWFKL